MVVSRTPKKTDDQDQHLETPFGQTFPDDPVDQKVTAKEADDDRFKQLQDEIARLHDQIETRDSRDFTLSTQQVTQDVFVPEQPVAIPNVNDDLEGFIQARTQNELIADRNKRGKTEFEKKNSKSLDDKVAELWSDFDQAYPEYGGEGNKSKVEFAAQEVVKRAVKRGLDANRYMFVARDRFMADLAKEMDTIFGEPEEIDDDVEETPRTRRRREARPPARRDTRRRPREDADERDTGRTAGLFGGNDSGGPRAPQRDLSGDSAGSMLDDIYAIQRKNGFM